MIDPSADKCKTFDKNSIKSPNFPNSYPLNSNCLWTIRIPNGTYITIGPFEYTFDCIPWEEGKTTDNVDAIYCRGFTGGKVWASSGQPSKQSRKCQGSLVKLTSEQNELKIEFKSDQVIEIKEPKVAKFNIPISNLQCKIS